MPREKERILLQHGDGGQLTHQLIEEVFLKAFPDPGLAELTDAAVLPAPRGRLAVTTDTFTVQPAFFPGGDLGELAVTGTVNDLAVSGARPLYLTVGMVLEEGLELETLERLAASLGRAAAEAGVRIVAGDTKVVPRGAADGLYINTTGVGEVPPGRDLGFHRIRPGDAILVTGPVGNHGVAVLSTRAGLAFETPVVSDAQPLHRLVEAVLAAGGDHVAFLRDPTRGGLATTLKEVALATAFDLEVEEAAIPVDPAVEGACELMGLDPLYLANEGKALIVCRPEAVEPVLAALHALPEGRGAARIGRVVGRPDGVAEPRQPGHVGLLTLKTEFGGTRRLEMLAGEPLPRIC